MNKYTIEKYKGHGGDETQAFDAELHCNRKKIAQVRNSGTGGPHEYQFLSKTNQDAWDAYVKTQPCEFDFEQGDQVVDAMIDAVLSERQMRRWCTTKVCWRLKGDRKDEWRTLKAPWSPQVEVALVQKYGDQVEEILNRRYS